MHKNLTCNPVTEDGDPGDEDDGGRLPVANPVDVIYGLLVAGLTVHGLTCSHVTYDSGCSIDRCFEEAARTLREEAQ